MWIFTVLGFYSIACANKPDGALDETTVMVRARRKEHLQKLHARFPVLAGTKIIRLVNRDYRYRIVISKSVWIGVLTELAAEQTWSKFKQQVATHHGTGSAAYVASLHRVWGLMHDLQER
jgi:hypothetical protein